MNKKLLAAVAMLAISTLSAGTIVLLQTKDKEPAPVEYWSKRITACQDTSLQDTGDVLEHSYDCLKSAIADAVFSKSFANFAAAAEPIMANDIKLEYVCHIPAHDLGRDIIEFYDYDWKTAIADMSYDLCGGGFVHSIYDIWGLEQHTQEEWVEVGDHCWDAIQVRYSACGDAVGHAAYESAGEDLRQAMIICDWQRELMIQSPCANGAYMQANFPQSTKLKQARQVVLREPSEWDEFVTFCDTVPFNSVGAKEGCYFGAGWVIGNTIFMMMQQARNELQVWDEFQSTPQLEERVLELVEYGVDACEAGAIDNVHVTYGCIYIMLARMPRFYYMDTPRFEELCRRSVEGFPESLYIECLASGHEHITPASMQDLINRYDGLREVLIRRGLSLPQV
jgi:hypothetical protein